MVLAFQPCATADGQGYDDPMQMAYQFICKPAQLSLCIKATRHTRLCHFVAADVRPLWFHLLP
jgi:hypothetical protein